MSQKSPIFFVEAFSNLFSAFQIEDIVVNIWEGTILDKTGSLLYSVPESTNWDVKTSTTHFPVPFGPIFKIFFLKIFLTFFSTAGNFLTVRDPPYGENF